MRFNISELYILNTQDRAIARRRNGSILHIGDSYLLLLELYVRPNHLKELLCCNPPLIAVPYTVGVECELLTHQHSSPEKDRRYHDIVRLPAVLQSLPLPDGFMVKVSWPSAPTPLTRKPSAREISGGFSSSMPA